MVKHVKYQNISNLEMILSIYICFYLHLFTENVNTAFIQCMFTLLVVSDVLCFSLY